MPIAVFGSKTFVVSNQKIYTFGNFSVGKSINTEAVEVEGNKPSTFIKGINLDTLAFEISLKSQYVKVKDEIDSWGQILKSKIPYPFMLGSGFISDNKWLLKSLDIFNTVIDNNGNMIEALLSLKFEEYVRTGRPKENESSAGISTPLDITPNEYKIENKRTNFQALSIKDRRQYAL